MEINAFLSCLKRGEGGAVPPRRQITSLTLNSSLLTPEMKGATERVIVMNTTHTENKDVTM